MAVQMSRFYDPAKQGPIHYTPRGTRATTAGHVGPESTREDQGCTVQTSGGREVPPEWTKSAFQTQVGYRMLDEKTRARDESKQAPGSIPVRSYLFGFHNMANWHEAQAAFKVVGIFPARVTQYHKRVGPYYAGDFSVTVHDNVEPGDELHAMFPHCDDTDQWNLFKAGQPLTDSACIAQLYPLLKHATRKDSFIPAQMPTLHVVTKQTLYAKGGLWSLERSADIMARSNGGPNIQPDPDFDDNAPEWDPNSDDFMRGKDRGEPSRQFVRALYGLNRLARNGNYTRANLAAEGTRIRDAIRNGALAGANEQAKRARRNAMLAGDLMWASISQSGMNSFIGTALTEAPVGGTALVSLNCMAGGRRAKRSV